MTRGKGRAPAPVPAKDNKPDRDPGDPHPAAQLRGEDGAGNVRPADNRFLTHGEIAMRDSYVADETGPTAQQLVVKRDAPEHVEALNSRDRRDEK